MIKNTNLKVLFLALEFPRWSTARAWSYVAQLALEDGFSKNGVDFTTITTQLFPHAKEICKGKQFDQIWVEIVQNNFDDPFWEWLISLAPVRIGIAFESIENLPQEIDDNLFLRDRAEKVRSRFKYLTHLIAIDEIDVKNLNENKIIQSFWWPIAVPKRFIVESISPPKINCAVFSGTSYGNRAKILQHPSLQGLLVHQYSPDRRTLFHIYFDTLQIAVEALTRIGVHCTDFTNSCYLHILRYIRQHNFTLYLNSLAAYDAVVNLPSFVKCYPSRVQEGMAMGRPIISNEIEDRPRTKGLFKDGHEILLYSSTEPEQLSEQIRRVLDDPIFASFIANNALHKIKRLHTTEHRVAQVITWLETGDLPDFE